jgi:hypothetical protein
VEIALEVSRRLVSVRREEFAADILFEVGRHDEAIDVCVTGGKFDKAKALSQGNAMLRRRVEDAYQAHLVGDEKHSELVDLGKADVALDVLARKGDWDRVWEVADSEGLSSLQIGKFVIMRVEDLVRKNGKVDIDLAVKTMNNRPAPATEKALFSAVLPGTKAMRMTTWLLCLCFDRSCTISLTRIGRIAQPSKFAVRSRNY